jgi:hypothetical protein
VTWRSTGVNAWNFGEEQAPLRYRQAIIGPAGEYHRAKGTGVIMSTDDVVIGELTVPPRLISMIRTGKWVPASDEILLEVFGDSPIQPCFYGEAMLIRENHDWQRDPANAGPPNLPIEGNLGILAGQSMVIADLGPGMPIVLDYRESPASPRVIYLSASAWREIAANFEELVERLCPRAS